LTWITGSTVHVLTNTSYFVPMLIITELYKNMGWGTIIFFAAISGVDDQLYEAAVMDGAGKLKQAIHITLPSIRPVIVIVLILSLGNIMNAGFDQIFMLYNPMVYSVADIIDTYVFRRGIIQADYSFAAAAGFFRSFVALILIVAANYAVRLFGDDGIW
jgi:putative aldouronate transport system permease protein